MNPWQGLIDRIANLLATTAAGKPMLARDFADQGRGCVSTAEQIVYRLVIPRVREEQVTAWDDGVSWANDQHVTAANVAANPYRSRQGLQEQGALG